MIEERWEWSTDHCRLALTQVGASRVQSHQATAACRVKGHAAPFKVVEPAHSVGDDSIRGSRVLVFQSKVGVHGKNSTSIIVGSGCKDACFGASQALQGEAGILDGLVNTFQDNALLEIHGKQLGPGNVEEGCVEFGAILGGIEEVAAVGRGAASSCWRWVVMAIMGPLASGDGGKGGAAGD